MIPNLGTIKIAVVLALVAWGALATWGWRHEVSAYAGFRASVEAQGHAAKIAAQQENAKHEQVVADVSTAWNQAIGPAQDQAVARYRAAHPDRLCADPGGSGVPPVAAGAEDPDAAAGQRLVAAPDTGFIRACASDALMVEMWQEWATLNRLPVRESP